MKLSIITPIYNNFNFTKSMLNDLSKLTISHEVIIIDNASTDQTQEQIKQFNIIYHRNDINEGFGRACTKAAKLSSGDIILFLNNDIRVKSNFVDWPEILIDAVQDGSLASPTMAILDQDYNFIKEKNGYIEGPNTYLSGWALAGKKETFEKLNYFDKDFFCYFEDADLSFRAKQLNIPLKIVDIPVIHFGKVSSRNLNTAKLYIEAKEIFTRKWKK